MGMAETEESGDTVGIDEVFEIDLAAHYRETTALVGSVRGAV
jgi:hypothetical protein